MKRFRIFLTVLLLVAAGSASLQGQSKDDKNRQKEIEKAISEQKKAMAQEKKDREQQKKDMEDQLVISKKDMDQAMKELENLKNLDVDVHVDDNGNPSIYRYGNRTIPQPFIPNPPNAPDAPRFHFYGVGDEEGTSWMFTKSVKEDSFEKEYSFEVDKSVKSVVMSVNGDCKAGEIRIKILTPQGRTYSDVVIDEFGNYNVRKSFNISETENQDKTGEWKFQVNSDNATGHFRISFQTY
jgi:hypothetical protein